MCVYESMYCVACVYVCGVGVCSSASGRFACMTIHFSRAQEWIKGSCWWERPATPFGATSSVSLLLTSALDPLMFITAALAGTPRSYSASSPVPRTSHSKVQWTLSASVYPTSEDLEENGNEPSGLWGTAMPEE